MELLRIDQERCVKCGICSKVCPMLLIGMTDLGPVPAHTNCIACGHCVAACPHDTLDHAKAPLSKQVQKTEAVLEPGVAEQFLRSRRSIRNYGEQKVPHDIMEKLLHIARFAPTGGNSQGLSYVVVEDPSKLTKVTECVICWMEEQIAQGLTQNNYIAGTLDMYRKTGYDIILRNAPNLIVAFGSVSNPQLAYSNARYTLEYVELYATSLGLGTCWAGLVEMCAMSGYQPLLELLKVGPEKCIAGVMMAGYPKYTYKRLVDREPLSISWL